MYAMSSSLPRPREEFSAIVFATYQGFQKYFTPCHRYETNKHASCYEVPRDLVRKFTKAISTFKMSVGLLYTEKYDFIFTHMNTTALFLLIFEKHIYT
jgi:hypothetical protein